MVLLVILLVFFLLYAVLFYFFLRGWNSAKTKGCLRSKDIFISVIIPARNEEKNIDGLLDSLKLQTYPSQLYEIIFVDDFSTDGTINKVQARGLENLRIIKPGVDENNSSKKKAIEAGIGISNGSLIVTTDADCFPPPGWLESIAALYCETEASFIAAPVKFSHDNSLLQVFQAIDFMTLQGITASAVSKRWLSMCNGANLAYTKQSFIDAGGFEGIDKVATGDDMLLMHKIWKRDPSKIHYLKNKDAIVITEPMTTWKDLFMQRKRWASKTFIYDDKKITAILAFVFLFNCMFPVLIITAISYPIYWPYVFGFWILKTLIEFPFVFSVSRFYGEERLMGSFFFLQPLHILFTIASGVYSQFGKYEWKGRQTK